MDSTDFVETASRKYVIELGVPLEAENSRGSSLNGCCNLHLNSIKDNDLTIEETAGEQILLDWVPGDHS